MLVVVVVWNVWNKGDGAQSGALVDEAHTTTTPSEATATTTHCVAPPQTHTLLSGAHPSTPRLCLLACLFDGAAAVDVCCDWPLIVVGG